MKDYISKFLLNFISDKNFTSIRYFFKKKKVLNLKKPTTFSEKLNYVKLYSENPLRPLVADRLKVREFVTSKNTLCKLIPVLWQGKELKEADFNSLPNQFVIKANHGSKMVALINKEKHSFKYVSELIDVWLKRDYYARGREKIYKDLERYIVIEKKLELQFGNIPQDFKFFCFDGKVELVEVDSDRFILHTRNFYDRSFNYLDIKCMFPNGEVLAKPIQFETAVEIAERLSEDFSFIRVDLYLLDDGSVYFGELTNYHGNGFETFTPESYDLYLGSLIKKLY